jgi:hypothetical protein
MEGYVSEECLPGHGVGRRRSRGMLRGFARVCRGGRALSWAWLLGRVFLLARWWGLDGLAYQVWPQEGEWRIRVEHIVWVRC